VWITTQGVGQGVGSTQLYEIIHVDNPWITRG
jgi:hypothetical protein